MVLLLVDVQNAIMQEKLYDKTNFIYTLITLISSARNENIEVIYICHEEPGMLRDSKEFQIYREFLPEEGEKIYIKQVNSAFRDTGLREYLLEKGEDTIVIAGLQTDYCIDATIRAGGIHGFKMIVPEKCNTTVDNEYMSAECTYRYYNEMVWDENKAKSVSLTDVKSMFMQM